jgi:2-keto-4-pentenoate hydratase/2-oxohepta-3-ene-1,7-dioic acid hydratase in catechol pathway
MMIVRFRSEGKVHDGSLTGERIVSAGDLYDLQDVEMLAPSVPSKIICIGLNYREHAYELKMRLQDEPIIFLKPPSAVLDPGKDIVYPRSSIQVDFEGELGVVIGKRCRNIAAKDYESYVVGYTCFNDVTARDLQRKDGQWTRSKSFDTFAPFGPWIAGIDPSDADIQTRINGEVRQKSNTSDLIFDVPSLVAFISSVMTLLPGDVIATGTPPGVGPIHVGDRVEVEIEGIGVLENNVVMQS